MSLARLVCSEGILVWNGAHTQARVGGGRKLNAAAWPTTQPLDSAAQSK